MPGLTYSAPVNLNGRNGRNGFDAHTDDAGQENHDSDGSDSDPPDATSSLVELNPEDFPTYFSERNGRLFHSSSSPYPLPVDTPEQERHTNLHNMLRQFVGAHYVGPVADTLALQPGSTRRRMALDVCTGNGKWYGTMMAEEFPHVHFRGFDIVPIATRYPPRNVQFEIHDVNTPLRWRGGTFDLVHSRFVAMGVRDYRLLVEEVARVLRPGGLFVAYEWSPYPAFDPSLQRDLPTHAPASCRLSEAINAALLSRGLHPIASYVDAFLESVGRFAEISSSEYYVPIGTWSPDPSMRSIGATCLEAHERYADSVRPMLVESGRAAVEVDNMLARYIQEVRTVDGLVSVLYIVHARKA
ncbi:S-adenosyl-L-methionine-dependent methyltransferase [Flammula alnicola]|nr:S-adenosyl-L-methionine-dependent methyltransferase [Flammula alnicola]